MIALVPTDDMDLVKSIAVHDDIWPRFSDGISKEDYFPTNNDREQWLIIIVDGEQAGLIRVYCESTCAISFHPFMLKKYRYLVREMAKAFFQWFMDTMPESFIKINVLTPECYKSTINASRKMGFKHEGTIRDSYRLGDKVYNQIASGMTREELKSWVA